MKMSAKMPPAERAKELSFSGALLRSFILAGLALYFGFKFLFPGYFHPLAAHHSDMYLMVAGAAQKWNWDQCWGYPRPILNMVASIAGDLGYEASLSLFTVVALLNTALVLSMLEVYYIKRRLSLMLSFLAVLLSVCAPCYYLYYIYDLGSVLAMFFGLLAVLVFEQGKGDLGLGRWLGFLGLCLLSALSKEGVVPALCVYGGLQLLVNWRRSKLYILGVVIPVAAFGVSLYHSSSIGSTFVNVAADGTNPYHISLAPADLFATFGFYYTALLKPGFVVLLLVSGLFSFYKGRGALFLGLLLLGASLLTPYLLLPNHKLSYYWWLPMAFWFGFPLLAATPGEGTTPSLPRMPEALRSLLQGRLPVFVTVIALLFGIQGYKQCSNGGFDWYLVQQDRNRNILEGVRSVKDRLLHSRSVLVLGLDSVFHPWHHPDFWVADLGFTGVWYFDNSYKGSIGSVENRLRVIDLSQIALDEFDLVLCFANEGRLVASFTGHELMELKEFKGIDASELKLLQAAPQVLTAVLCHSGADSTLANRDVGFKLCELHCYGMAERFFQKVLRDDTVHDPYLCFFYGRIHMLRGRYAEAVKCFEQAIQYDNPELRNVYFPVELEKARAALKSK